MPGHLSIPIQERFEISVDYEKIRGVIHKTPVETDACVVCCHGLLANKDGIKYIKIGEMLSKLGINVVRFDFRGCGESDGKLKLSSITKRSKDLDMVIEYLFNNYGYHRFGLFGSSMGGFISLIKASKDTRIKVLVSLASPYTISELFETHRIDDSHFMIDGIIFGKEFILDIKSRGKLTPEIIGNIQCPVYIFQGDLDNLVPKNHAFRIYEALKSVKLIKIINGGDHIFSNPYHLAEIIKISCKWYLEYLIGV